MTRFSWLRRLHAQPTKAEGKPVSVVQGERDRFIAGGARSLQSRINGLLAGGLMAGVGAAMLAWYYAETLSHPATGRAPIQASLPQPAGEGMSLPAFGSIALSRLSNPTAPVSPARPLPFITALPSSAMHQAPFAVPIPQNSPLEPPLERAPVGLARGYGGSPPAPHQQLPDRRLSGEVFAVGARGVSSNVAAGGLGEEGAPGPFASRPDAQVAEGGSDRNALQALLVPAVLNTTRAQLVPPQRLLLPKGTFIDCTLETAIDSTLPGMTTCITATDTFGADGMVVLLERGTKLIGETRGDVGQGQARVFVVWTEARTPSGVVVRLDSPGTDALGRSGLDGSVNRHFWQRFGAAVLVSTIDGVVQSQVESSSRNGTVVLDPTASEDVLNDVLRSTVNILPTIRVRNGARIQVLVARDLDFRPVYELEPR